jgi:DNA-binding transcriptional LysR family regulator
MDTQHLRSFVAVARLGSFTRASQELFMTQSTVSRHVAALERRLDTVLLARGPRNVALTRPGSAFLPRAEAVLEAVDAAELAARGCT